MIRSRRKFLEGIVKLGIIGAFYSFFKIFVPGTLKSQEKPIKIGKVDEFKPDTGKIIRIDKKPVLLLRLENGEFRAFSGFCTHNNCIVQYRSDMKAIWCACHKGKFDLEGKNIEGPPPRPLDRFRVIIEKGEVYIAM
ncbi:MAG: Rieske (2Fe-2S) protein [Candidatus Kryptonium sp.]|nr:Rieske (2Fe-2S) protein [Candidatus Kryptonium sp.]